MDFILDLQLICTISHTTVSITTKHNKLPTLNITRLFGKVLSVLRSSRSTLRLPQSILNKYNIHTLSFFT